MLPPNIAIQHDPGSYLRDFIQSKTYTKIGLLVDDNTERLCYPLVQSAMPPHILIKLPPGEENKNITTCSQTWEELTRHMFDRRSLLIILGGGVLGDMGGFCAATFKRGIDFVIVPTTLLAQADASVGGKLGIDFRDLKNHIGLFCEPVRTVISTRFLKSLPPRELRSGFAEVIKHCLISDRPLWDTIRKRTLADQPWDDLIRHSVEFKASVVQEDPREVGKRKILNFGHSVGHAIEGHFLSKGDKILHGEAVAMGMAGEAFIAYRMGMLDKDELSQIIEFLTEVFSPFRQVDNTADILERMGQDKKNEGNRVLMALPDGIGHAKWDVDVSESEVLDALTFLKSLHT